MARRQPVKNAPQVVRTEDKAPTGEWQVKTGQIIQWTYQIIVAICAAIGIFLTISSSSRTANVLKQASETFLAYNLPVVKFTAYQWIVHNQSELSCENPALGIFTYYRNSSGVPIAVEDSQLTLAMGNRPILTGPPEIEAGEKGEIILAPGEQTARSIEGGEFPQYYKRMQGTKPPHLNFTLSVTYRSLATGGRYKYTGKVILQDHCMLPKQQRKLMGPERIEKLEENKLVSQ